MNRKFPLYLLLVMLVASIAVSCNSDEEELIDSAPTVISGGTAITSFALEPDEDVLLNLDSVFFSIDLANRRIYNADSLPKGTDVSGLRISIEHSGASVEVVQVAGKVRPDTVFTLGETETDTIDFTGNVGLRVKAANGTEAYYYVKVNVHTQEPDSLYWNRLARRDLPFADGKVLAQKTVVYKEKAYSLVNSANAGLVLSCNENPYYNQWEKVDARFDFVPDVSTLEATGDALYILDENGALYTSADGESWTSCGVTWCTMIGGYTDRVLGLQKQGSAYMHDEYPRKAGFASTEVDIDFPVSEASQFTYSELEWGVEPQGFIVGGITSDGKYRGDVWAYDGKAWSMIRSKALPSLAGMTVFEYVNYEKVAETTTYITHRAWFAVGGRNVKGLMNSDVYISRHQGLYWSKADQLLQMPDYIEPRCGAQAYVFETTHTRASDGGVWTSMPSKKLPVWARIDLPLSTRVSQDISSWDSPYIYLFGGVNEDGNVCNEVWRGVLNRLTFKPII